ncbi:MAG TPA: porin [Longimicrobiales bacterium]|nr:porin [Longimicrobiales bacterium]
MVLVTRLAICGSLISLSPLVTAAQEASRYPDVHPNGRLQLDAVVYRDDRKDLSNGTEVRRARLALLGALAERWTFQLEADFSDNEIKVSDAWVLYHASPAVRVQLGNFKEPFSLEAVTSSRFITFLERSLADAFVDSRNIGAAVRAYFAPISLTVGAFGQDPGELGDSELGDSEGWSLDLRATAAPILTDRALLHLGGALRHRTPDARAGGGDRARFRTYSESHLERTRFLDTGPIAGVTAHDQLGLEAAVVYGPWSLQAERIFTAIRSQVGDDPVLSGAYAYISWVITGESRVYVPATGVFMQPVPRRAAGAVELAARYSTVDLNDGAVAGGAGTNWTLAANWYANESVRISANYVITDHDLLADANGTQAGDDDFSALQLRIGFFF